MMCGGVRAAWRCCLSACLERMWELTETGAVSSGGDTDCGLVGYDVTWSSRWLPWLPQLLRSVLTPSCTFFYVEEKECCMSGMSGDWLIDYFNASPLRSSGAPLTIDMHLTSECAAAAHSWLNVHCPLWVSCNAFLWLFYVPHSLDVPD
jgi:hypothetical protein